MLQNLPLFLLAEAVNSAVNIKNCLFHTVINISITYDVIHRQPASAKRLQPFRHKCFIQIPEEKRSAGTKLSARAEEGIFVGYTNSNKIFVSILTQNAKFPTHGRFYSSCPYTREASTIKQSRQKPHQSLRYCFLPLHLLSIS